MALLVDDTFYTVTFLPPDDAAWAAAGTPTAPGGSLLAEAIYKAVPTQIQIYVISAAAGLFAFYGGQANGFDDTLLAAAATTLTDFTFTDMDGNDQRWAKYVSGGNDYVLVYDSVAGVLRQFEDPAIADLKTFLP